MADFRTFWGIDVLDFFCGVQGWVIFYSYFNSLPSYSKTKAKIASDPEIAKAMTANIDPESLLDEDEEPKEVEVPVEGYDASLAKQDQVIEEIRLLRVVIQSMFGGKKGEKIKFNPQPRPKTEAEKQLERLKSRAGEQESKNLMREAGF